MLANIVSVLLRSRNQIFSDKLIIFFIGNIYHTGPREFPYANKKLSKTLKLGFVV